MIELVVACLLLVKLKAGTGWWFVFALAVIVDFFLGALGAIFRG